MLKDQSLLVGPYNLQELQYFRFQIHTKHDTAMLPKATKVRKMKEAGQL